MVTIIMKGKKQFKKRFDLILTILFRTKYPNTKKGKKAKVRENENSSPNGIKPAIKPVHMLIIKKSK